MLLAAALGAFNLVCVGESSLWEPGSFLPKEKPIPMRAVYRIDLDAARWCRDTCSETEAIQTVVPTLIVLRNRPATTSGGVSIETYLNRETGKVVDKFILGSTVTMFMGACEKAPFSGFPALKF